MRERGLGTTQIIDVLKLLIGKTESVGDSLIDAYRFENFRTLMEVCDWCLCVIQGEYEYKNSSLASVEKSGKEAEKYLIELKKWVDDVLEEVEE